MYHQNRGKSLGQLMFGRDMIIPINHIAECKYILHHKQVQIEKYVIQENSTRIGHDYRVGDRVMIIKHAGFKYETTFKGPY